MTIIGLPFNKAARPNLNKSCSDEFVNIISYIFFISR